MKKLFNSSELVLAPDGSLYHIRLFPDQIADTVLLVGDPGRVKVISSLFSSVESTAQNREIMSCTGTYKGKRITVISTGMGTDNIDIVVTELDAAVNIDLTNKVLNPVRRSLHLIRLGTSGAVQPSIAAGDCILSSYAIGIDGLLYFYKNNENVIHKEMTQNFIDQMHWDVHLPMPYAVSASDLLLEKIKLPYHQGITVTSPGFYGPQGRQIRLEPSVENFGERLRQCQFKQGVIANFEMETSALYGLSAMLGHEALTICLAIANRSNGTFLSDYSSKMSQMIEEVLNVI